MDLLIIMAEEDEKDFRKDIKSDYGVKSVDARRLIVTRFN